MTGRRPTAALLTLLTLLGLALATPSADAQIYVAFGDSITVGVGDDPARPPEQMGYPPRLDALLRQAGRDVTVINAGEGGENTIEGLERLTSALTPGGDVLLLMEGSNDISNRISGETTLFNLDQMARRAISRSYEVVHTTVIPRIPGARLDSANVLNQQLNQGIRELAGTTNRRLVDNYERFGSVDDVFAQLYWIDPGDFVGHPNGPGYDVMARTFFDVLTGADSSPPVDGLMEPVAEARNVPPGTPFFLSLWDFGTGIDLANTDLLINGVEVTPVVEGTGRHATLTYQPAGGFANVVNLELRTRDLASPPNQRTKALGRFIVAGTRFLTGDIDESGRVDGADLLRLALAFGASQGQGRYNSRIDINLDAIIDGDDLALLAANFGRSSF